MAVESIDSFITPEKIEDAPNISKSHRRASIASTFMADESIDSFITPEKIEDAPNISKSHRRASIGSYHAGDSLKKSSTEKSDSANGNRNVVPNYLRASTGSCHDFCKYGKKHSSDEKAKKPLRKRIAKPSPDELPVLIMVPVERNKEKAIENQKSHTDTKNPSPDSKSFSPKPKISPEKKKIIKNKPSTDTKKPHSPDKKAHLRKPENPSDAKNKPVLLKPKSLSTKKCPSLDPPEIVKSVFFPFKKDEDNKMPIKSKPVKATPLLSSSSDNSDGVRGKGRKNSESNSSRNMTTTSKASAKKVSAAPRAATLSTKLPIIKTAHNNSRKGQNEKLVSYPKDRNKIRTVNKIKTSDNEKVPEKVLHVVETENKNNVIEPISAVGSLSHEISSVLPSHKEDNKATAHCDVVISKNESLEIICKVSPVKENNHNKTPKKTKVVVCEDNNKNRTPVKLKFRNGKIMDVQLNSNVPRKLRFRRARVIGADEVKSDLRRRIFKKAGVGDHKAREEFSSEKIVLKHQDLQGKKDGQGLLNNDIIEQTASKLVESRKSKVKALVGAFETVISLQENKPSS